MALQARGKADEAIISAETTTGLNAPLGAIASFCEGVLLGAGRVDEAYTRYGGAFFSGTDAPRFRFISGRDPVSDFPSRRCEIDQFYSALKPCPVAA